MMCFSSLYPRHLCRGLYSFHLFVHPLICSIGLYFRPVRGINSKFYVQPTKWPVCPAKTVHSMVAKSARFFMRTGQMPRMICVSSAHMSFCWFCHAAAHILDEVPSLWCAFLHFTIKMFNAVKNAKAILISYFHSYVYIKQIRRVL